MNVLYLNGPENNKRVFCISFDWSKVSWKKGVNVEHQYRFSNK